jgi:predicted transcriptional regulator
MIIAKPIGSIETDKSLEMDIGRNVHELEHASAAFSQPENRHDEITGNHLGTLLRRVTELSTREIENLIDELHGLRKKLETDSDRIQSAIARHSELSQGVMQLTAIISDNVQRLPKPTY